MESGWQPSASVDLSLVLPRTTVLSLQSVGPRVCVSVVSASPGTLEDICGRGHQASFSLQFYSAASGMRSLLKYAFCGTSYLLPFFSMIQANV